MAIGYVFSCFWFLVFSLPLHPGLETSNQELETVPAFKVFLFSNFLGKVSIIPNQVVNKHDLGMLFGYNVI
jgi:hypothetical protein